ncbi:MAG: N-acetyltransferase family protein, partial [Christensenellaceae bacterium]
FWPIAREPDSIRVKSVFCFVIAPDWQRRGIATRLLQRVCQDAAREGYDFVEAYVDTNTESEDFRGYLEMYEKCGFRLYAQREGRAVVRRALKQLPDRR